MQPPAVGRVSASTAAVALDALLTHDLSYAGATSPGNAPTANPVGAFILAKMAPEGSGGRN